MNAAGTMVPSGFLGEIYVYGNGVCNGYYQNPLLTDEKFAENELGRHYKSGDLAWQIGDSYYYLGRRDRQVKIRGFRIELGEIEYLLKKHVAKCDFIVLFAQDKLIDLPPFGQINIQIIQCLFQISPNFSLIC